MVALCLGRRGSLVSQIKRTPAEADASILKFGKEVLSAIPTPTRHRTETKKSEADQAECRGFGYAHRADNLIPNAWFILKRSAIEGFRSGRMLPESKEATQGGCYCNNSARPNQKLPGIARNRCRVR